MAVSSRQQPQSWFVNNRQCVYY